MSALPGPRLRTDHGQPGSYRFVFRVSTDKRAAGQEIEHRIMLSPRHWRPHSMAKSKHKRTPKTVLKLPDLEQSKSAVMSSLTSASSKRSYDHAIREFI